jgi:hypothetical protein
MNLNNEQSPDLKYYAYSWAIVGLNDIESSINCTLLQD